MNDENIRNDLKEIVKKLDRIEKLNDKILFTLTIISPDWIPTLCAIPFKETATTTTPDKEEETDNCFAKLSVSGDSVHPHSFSNWVLPDVLINEEVYNFTRNIGSVIPNGNSIK